MKKSDKLPNEEEIRKFFESKINQSGYSLQTAVQNKLRKAHFETSREEYYLDKDESKGRPLDLISYKIIPDERVLSTNQRYVAGALRLVIECKQLPDNAWIFFHTIPPAISVPESLSITWNMNPDPANRYMPPFNHLIDMPFVDGYAELILPNNKNKIKSNERQSNLYEAIMTVTKATRYEMESTMIRLQKMIKILPPRKMHDRILLFSIYQPLIVFKGRMYESIQEQDHLKLKPIRFAQMPKKYVSKNYEEVLGQIHVVSYDAFDEYLNIVQKYYNENAQKMIQDQSELISIVDTLS